MKDQPADATVDKVLELVAEHYKITLADIRGGKEPKIARRLAVYLLKEEFGQTLRVIQDKLGIGSAPTLYADLKKFKDSLPNDRALGFLIETIKTEALMLTVSQIHSAPTDVPPQKSPPRNKPSAPTAPIVVPPPVAKHLTSTSTHPLKESEIVEMVQTAVSEVCLGPTLLNSPDAGEEVKAARDILIYLIWRDFVCASKLPLKPLIERFHLTEESFFTAIGRVTVRMEGLLGGFQLKVADVRKKYSSQITK
jgi:hypothetical protein